MADEQTPKSFDDEVAPVEPGVPDGSPLDEAERAARARAARPRRKKPEGANPEGSAVSAPKSFQPAPDDFDELPEVASNRGATRADLAADVARPAIPRPVRRGAAAAGERAEVVSSTRDTVVARTREPQAPAARRRTTPATFVGQSVDELRKVVWPTRNQLTTYFIVVLAFVLFVVAYVGALDVFFGWLLLKLFGK